MTAAFQHAIAGKASPRSALVAGDTVSAQTGATFVILVAEGGSSHEFYRFTAKVSQSIRIYLSVLAKSLTRLCEQTSTGL
jgi:hypothetical protein